MSGLLLDLDCISPTLFTVDFCIYMYGKCFSAISQQHLLCTNATAKNVHVLFISTIKVVKGVQMQ